MSIRMRGILFLYSVDMMSQSRPFSSMAWCVAVYAAQLSIEPTSNLTVA